MPKRGEFTKQIVMSPKTYERFRAYNIYHMPNEGLLLAILDELDRHRAKNGIYLPELGGIKYNTSPALSPRDIVKEPQNKE
jgi:hypothetical protein